MQRRPFLLSLLALSAAPALRAEGLPPLPAMQPVLRERLEAEGVGLACAQADPEGLRLSVAGVSAAGGQAAIDGSTLFELGGLSRAFTALLLADAVTRGEIQLADPVEAALPDGLKLRDNADRPLRWIDLATHRSGLPPHPADLPTEKVVNPYAAYGAKELLAFLKSWKSDRPRDVVYEPSDTGYAVLGLALAHRAGIDYARLLRERVLAPLHLNGVRLAGRGPAPEGLAHGHDARRTPVAHWQFDAFAPAQGLLASASDLGRFLQAALGLVQTPLASAFALCLRQHGAGPRDGHATGFAWALQTLDGRTVASLGGSTAGFSSSAWLDPQRRRGAAVLSNAAIGVIDLAIHAMDPSIATKDAKAMRVKAITLSAEQLAPLAGTYAYAADPKFKLVIRVQENRLFGQATGQGEFELFASSERQFFARVTPLQLTFEGERGTPPALDIAQGGKRLHYVREP